MGFAEYLEVDSTNSLLLRQAKDGLEEGAWALARRQTGGRGRQGRSWQSIDGNFHASTLVRLGHGDPAAATLSLVAAVAFHRAMLATCPIAADRLRIKWPNDLVARRDGHWGKIAGILLEREGEAVIAGFGANLVQAPELPDRPTVSAALFGEPPSTRDLCFALGRCFAEELERWRGRGAADIRRRWLDRAHPEGTPLTVHLSADETASGTFEGIESDGALRLATAHGVQVVRAGDVDLAD